MRLYNVLLGLYPASFRNEYGEEMRALFRRRRQQASGAGIAVLWLTTAGEIFANAMGAHLDILTQDLSYVGRTLKRSPGFAFTAILIVALGIGATTAAFSVTDFVLIRPLPFPEPDRLVRVAERTPGYDYMEFSAPNYRDWKAAARSYESMGVYRSASVTMTGLGEPRRLLGSAVSADLFPTLRVAPVFGRPFAEADDRFEAPGTVMLSYRFWQTEFGGDANVVGQILTFDAKPYTVIGVMPREFNFPRSDVQFWIAARFGEREDSHVSRSRQSPGLDGGRGNWDRRGIIEPEVIGDVETTFIGSV